MDISMMISKRFKYRESYLPYTYPEHQVDGIKMVRNKIDEGKFSLKETNCPCKGKDFGVIASTERYGLPLQTVLCNKCGSLRFKEYLTDKSLADFYINHYQTMYGRLTDLPNYFIRQGIYGKRILESYRPYLKLGDNILEVGCGAGGALNIFKKEGIAAFGCEYSQVLVNYANQQGLNNVQQGSLFDIEKTLPLHIKFNLIYIHHVFEHVVDPLALLKKCKSLLSEHGKLVIGVPDFLRIDQYENPGCDLMIFLHIAHKYNFTSECFDAMATQVDLQGKKILLHPDYPTPWSVQPELWFEFSNGKNTVFLDEHRKIGNEIHQYLVSTEDHYTKKTCPWKKMKIKWKVWVKLKKRLTLMKLID